MNGYKQPAVPPLQVEKPKIAKSVYRLLIDRVRKSVRKRLLR